MNQQQGTARSTGADFCADHAGAFWLGTKPAIGLLAATLAVFAACSSPSATISGSPEDTLALCSDGTDNDGDGLVDCADTDCEGSTDKAIIAYCVKHGDASIKNDVKKDAEPDTSDSELPNDASDTGDVNTSDAQLCKLAGGFGCPCITNSDCDSYYCIEGDQGKMCTTICSDNCPADFKCIQASGSDANFICVPKYPTLCMPCNDHKQCQTNGVTDSYCVPFDRGSGQSHGWIDGHFCMTACTPVTDATGKVTDTCKTGYHCQELKLFATGGAVKQCVPDSGECGCHDAWSQEGKATECHKTSVSGICTSKRQCQVDTNGKAILTVCDAPDPATEVCGDGVDNDCNGQTDEPGAGGCKNWYLDNDGDGFGSGAASVENCLCNNPGTGYSSQGKDCNDFATSIHPGAIEICNNTDDNCNGETDESGSKGCTVFYHDLDGDGYGSQSDSACMCKSKATTDWILQAADCDDTPGTGAKIHPGVDEICDGIDNNCNGKTDEQGAIGCKLYYADQDGDTYGVTTTGLCLCASTKSNPAGQPGDCDDGNASVNPSQPEICDGIDNDCDGKTDGKSADASCGTIEAGKSKCLDGGICGTGGCDKGYFDIDGLPGCECKDAANVGNMGMFCSNAIDVGVLPDGSATIQKAGQILPGEGGDWYKFDATDTPDINGIPSGSCDQYDVRISFVLNPNGIFVFDVFRGSCGAGDQVCSAETQHDWSTSFYGPTAPFGPKNKANVNVLGSVTKSPSPEIAGECNCVPAGSTYPACTVTNNVGTGCGPNGYPGMNICSDNSSWYFVRVYTKPGAALTCDQYIIKFDNSSTGAPPPQ